ncbi:MAG TPA: carboxypeptidase regulatory-like domain-containing protein [Gemmatimonadaceae bacterium]|nr:carboxypeptidase regulatory-like domain-containing protein [Gemmatimonadaceae bacterium]
MNFGPQHSRSLGALCVGLACVGVLLQPPALHAQARGSITGTVTDSAGLPISGARVTVENTAFTTLSDERGAFRLLQVPSGVVSVQARRLGFRPTALDVEVSPTAGATVTFRLGALAQTLAPIIVRRDAVEYSGRLAGYYQRLERKNGGVFITRDQIDRENPRMVSHLLQRVPGITVGRARGGMVTIRMRGRACWPLVWLDGVPMPAGEVDVDTFNPQSLHGIELYLGSTTPPSRYTFQRNMSSCGTILLWSRGPDTDPAPVRRTASRELEALVGASAVYTEDQVEQPASLLEARALAVPYPPALSASGVTGLVVAEFVIDVVGRPEMATFGVVSSTHPLFSDAVRRALETARFEPAVRGGRPVRQLIHQRFNFGQPSSSSMTPLR